MKKILLFFFIIPLASFSQTDLSLLRIDTSRHIINDANVIYVQNSDFKKACNALLDAGFTIESKDAELETVTTKEIKNDFWIPVLSIRIKNGVTIIRAKVYDCLVLK